MTPRIPEIEIADDADPPRIWREHHESDAFDAVQGHRMRAQLVIQPLIGAFAEKVQVEVAQHRREAIGIVELDDILAILRSQLIAPRAVWQGAREQAGVVDARQRSDVAMFA